MVDQPDVLLNAYEGHAYAVTFSPDGGRLLAGGFGGLIRSWDTTSWQDAEQYAHHEKSVNAIVFAPGGASFAASSSDRTVSLWRGEDDSPLTVLKGHRNTVMGLTHSPDGALLASGATDSTIRLWPAPGEGGEAIVLKSPFRIVSHVDFLDDGARLIAAGGGDEALVWSVESREIIAALPGHGSGARVMQTMPNDGSIMTQGGDGVIRIWSAAEWSLMETYDIGSAAPRSARLSPDGARLAVLEERRVRLLAVPSPVSYTHLTLPTKRIV